MKPPARNMKGQLRWPGLAGQPRPRIPVRAEERVTQRDTQGIKSISEFWLHGQCVGRAFWDPDGSVSMAYGLRRGVVHGYHIEYHPNGAVSSAEPYIDGERHGRARQFDSRGRLV